MKCCCCSCGYLLLAFVVLFLKQWACNFCTAQFSSVQDGMFALGKAHMHSTLSLRSFPNVAFDTVPMLIWLMIAIFHPFNEGRLALPLAMPVSSRWSMVWCPWLCACRQCLKLHNTSDLLRSKPLVMVALPPSLSSQSFPFTPACPGQYTYRRFLRWMSTIDTVQSGLPIPLFTQRGCAYSADKLS